MAVLSENERFAGWAQLMRDMIGTVSILKSDLRAAFDALDVFLNDNTTAINNAIPQPARAALSTQQKALVLMAVVARRYLNS